MSKQTSKPLLTSLRFIPAIPSELIPTLEKIGIKSAGDLLFYFPRRYEDYQEVIAVREATVGQTVSLMVSVREIDHTVSMAGKMTIYALVEQDGHYLRIIWFNQPYLIEKIKVGMKLALHGTVTERGGRLQILQPKFTIMDAASAQLKPKLLPVYGLTEGLKQKDIRRIVRKVVERFADQAEEALPDNVRQELGLCDIHTAIRWIHAPESNIQAEEAQRRFAFQELLILQVALAKRRHQVTLEPSAPALPLTPMIENRIRQRLPFTLTESQEQVFHEIAKDLERTIPMNRLLHGDVGSGKTAVAICALLQTIAHGHQAILMAPTEILARQHERTLRTWLQSSRVKIALWTGSTSHRQQMAERIHIGEIDIVVGTQAIVESELKFAKLGLIIIDEQHKFGVRQRARLKQLANHDPHYLVMTATPIPRTISMTVFGDLDVSTLVRPANAPPLIKTYLGSETNRDKWWSFFCKKIDQGRQGYVIAPLVDSTDESKWVGVEGLYESLVNGVLANYRVDLLHGRQSAEEKDATLRAFANGHTQVIVATSVVEVGIDVPNATVMTIESAERFGLSQLHQLRGRVCRSKHMGYVCVFSSSGTAEDNQRLRAFVEHADGFKLAEIDMQLRGPGNLFSTEQTGFPPLIIADLIRDAGLVSQAREMAAKIVAADPDLKQPELERLRRQMVFRYGSALDISDVG